MAVELLEAAEDLAGGRLEAPFRASGDLIWMAAVRISRFLARRTCHSLVTRHCALFVAELLFRAPRGSGRPVVPRWRLSGLLLLWIDPPPAWRLLCDRNQGAVQNPKPQRPDCDDGDESV